MRKYLLIVLIIAIAVGTRHCLVSTTAYAVVMDKIVAVVNDEVITQQELNQVLLPVYLKYREVYQGDEFKEKIIEARKEALTKVIEDRLVLSEAKRLQVIVDEAEVDEKIADIEIQFDNEDDFLVALEKEGLTLPQLRERYHNQIMARKLIDYRVRGQVNITPTEIANYYQQKLADFMEPPTYGLINLVIRVNEDDDKDNARELADKILMSLKLGKTFEELVEEHKDAEFPPKVTDMGKIRITDLAPEIASNIEGLKAGEYSAVVESTLGYHIFKVTNRSKGRQLDFNEAREAIRENLFMKKAEERYTEWMEELKSNAYISIKEENLSNNDR